MSYIDGYPVVKTPPFAERFALVPHSSFYECVVCGKRGFYLSEENKRGWTYAHSHHIRCTCGKALTTRGLPMHRSAMARHGKPCPPLNKMTYPPKPTKLQKLVMLKLFNGVHNLGYGGRGSYYQRRKAEELIKLIRNFREQDD